MSQIKHSPVARFPGHVTIPDYLNFPQLKAFRDAMTAAKELGKDASLIEYHHACLPGVLPIIEQWNMDTLAQPVTADTFPVTPFKASQQLASWLIGLAIELTKDAEEIPNA